MLYSEKILDDFLQWFKNIYKIKNKNDMILIIVFGTIIKFILFFIILYIILISGLNLFFKK
jgi:hypothetical protein